MGKAIKKVLIANRGAIAVRIERTLKKMGIKSVALYTEEDQDSLHVSGADQALFIGKGTVKETYLNRALILEKALKAGVDAIHPGYGFLSENVEFAEECESHGMAFIGPRPEHIRLFGLKHEARALAEKHQVPLLSGTRMLETIEDASSMAAKIGYPVMIKSTAGGGGIGIQVCHDEKMLLHVFESTKRMAGQYFAHEGVFIEKYIFNARHVEVQVFGDGKGNVVALGDRDCSLQRRNQKVIEECPAPFIPDEVRERMHDSAVRLMEAMNYKNAGTVEFLYDTHRKKYYFLEVNTRLQVEHGITEEVYNIDLVEWMIREAAGEMGDLLKKEYKPKGHAIEARLYGEDAWNDFRPSSGKIDEVFFSNECRVETWIKKGIELSTKYDSMLAKIIVHDEYRNLAVTKMDRALEATRIYGSANNLLYLSAVMKGEAFRSGNIHTQLLNNFKPKELSLEVLDGGVQSTIQDYPGMEGYWHVGLPPCGPMDSLSFRMGNKLLDNPEGASGIEMTLKGGQFRLRTSVDFCITGADMHPTLEDESIPMYQVIQGKKGQILRLGSCEKGMRSYLLIKGGFDVPKIFGSSATFTDGRFGGHNGRALRSGDILRLNHVESLTDEKKSATLKAEFQPIPLIGDTWALAVIPGPQPTEEYLKPEYLQELREQEFVVDSNSARTGIRLNGSLPKWTREDGGEAGLHPSNIHDNPYVVGALDLTGDQAVLLGPDGPSLGGFVCPVTMAKGDLWKLGQLRPGDRVRFKLVTLEEAAWIREQTEHQICGNKFDKPIPESFPSNEAQSLSHYAILEKDNYRNTDILIRLSGEEAILVEYGPMELDFGLRLQVHMLMEALQKFDLPLLNITPGIRSLQISFDSRQIAVGEMAKKIIALNRELEDVSEVEVPSRIIYLPLSWNDPQTIIATKRYQETVRPNAPWCPSNPEFIRRINGMESIEAVQNIIFEASYMVLGLGDVYLGAPVATPIDPRHRLVTTKYNPARPWTPENAVGIGGAYLCVYGMEGPGGYQFVGRTIQMWNLLQETDYFNQSKPWLLDFFDQIRFYPVSAEEILELRHDFLRGRFSPKVEHTTFSMKAYKEFFEKEKISIEAFKEQQQEAFRKEKEDWKKKGLDSFVTMQTKEKDKRITSSNAHTINTDMPGSIWTIHAKAGERIEKGDEIITLESMKMEFIMTADRAGVIEEILVECGDTVQSGQPVLIMK
ncbi:urea carboxylase [Spirochaeta cellobiosiphila]|uniref:urea carboxylase n=1 Tax=Spirochaeta cellobiosiphila TaxID=504483 RepID=UPI000419D34B|nr:urea carboxylase [Spirochaeta cellobiosiphila]